LLIGEATGRERRRLVANLSECVFDGLRAVPDVSSAMRASRRFVAEVRDILS
jgi:hypothetical protein